jgi:hypothetical protein
MTLFHGGNAFPKVALTVAMLACAASASAAEGEAQRAGDGGASLSAAANVAGLALMGPALSVEYGSSISLLARGHLLGLGYLAGQIIPNESLGEELQLGSLGAGLGGRWYPGSRLQQGGPYVGVLGEFLSVKLKNREEIITSTPVYVVGAEGGYRWLFGSLFVGAGAELGYSMPQEGTCEAPAGVTCLVVSTQPAQFYGQGVLDLGVVF